MSRSETRSLSLQDELAGQRFAAAQPIRNKLLRRPDLLCEARLVIVRLRDGRPQRFMEGLVELIAIHATQATKLLSETQQKFCSHDAAKTFVDVQAMSVTPKTAEAARAWMKRERDKRGWSTTKLADVARTIAHREGSPIKLTQQTVSGFEQPDGGKRLPIWLPFVVKAFEEGDQPTNHQIARRDELVYIRQVDISYAMGAGVEPEEYPETNLIPFNLGFVQAISRAPLEKLFLATGHGESMEPTLLRHDLILVDTSQQQLSQSDLIWALNYAGGSMIKRLRRVRREGRDVVLIHSDNPAVLPEEADLEDVHIVGKVVWIGRRM